MPEHYGEQIRKSGDAMNDAAIVRLADEDGLEAVAEQFGCTRQQAENVIERARARVKAMHPGRIGRNGEKALPRIGHAFSDPEVREMAEKVAPAALVGLSADEYRAYQQAEKERLRRERNAANGYPERGPAVHDFEPSTAWLERNRQR
jgi:hypothetical protein